VLGAVRFDYSLDTLFTRVEQNILTSALSLTLIFGLGLLLTLWVIRTWIVRPLNQLTRSMEEATDRNDFGHRLEGDEGDEIGRVALAYNQMLDSVERQIGKRPASQGQATRISSRMKRLTWRASSCRRLRPRASTSTTRVSRQQPQSPRSSQGVSRGSQLWRTLTPP